MKNILAITALVLLTISVFSQSSDREEIRNEMKSYFEETINPFLLEQQTKYIEQLSDEEKIFIESLKQRKNEHKMRSKSNNGKETSKDFKENRNKIDEIVEAHPDLNRNYENAIVKETKIWENELQKIHDRLGIETGEKYRSDTRHKVFFERISEPQALLMWSENNVRNHRRGMRNKSGNGEKSKAKRKELRAEVKDYFIDEIAPVIYNERKEFESQLSDDEKKIIDDARQKMEVRKAMFRSWYESEDFEPGKRARDPNFDNMRDDMRSSMKKVNDIAEIHKEELKKIFDGMKDNKSKWTSDIRNIAQSYSVEPRETIHSSSMKYKKFLSPIRFLMIDPENDQKNMFVVESDIKVFIYPNPMSTKGNIVITGAVDQVARVILYSQSGEIVKELHDGNIDINRFEITLSAEDLDDKLYILKVTSGGNSISRKIIID